MSQRRARILLVVVAALQEAAAGARERVRHVLSVLGIVAVFGFGAIPGWAQPNVLISELCDPRLNYLTDRFIEVYNAGTTAVDLAGWKLVAVGNGGDIFTWNLSGLIQPGEALVAGDQTPTVAFPVDFPDEAWSNNNSLWNGKIGDGAKLLDPSATIVDYVVADGTRFENQDYVRKYTVNTPSTTYDPLEWTATSVDLPTQGSPGAHDTEPPVPVPTISFIHTEPSAPFAGEEVDVLADVTDLVATIASVVLRWGIESTSLPNEIGMDVLSGDTYRTLGPIPPQSEGLTVFYEIVATNDIPASSTSELQSYSLPSSVSIFEIQGSVPASPYDGLPVITSGIVTATYGSFFVMQDGSGPWNGIWAKATTAPSVGDSISVRGVVSEAAGAGDDGNTMLVDAMVLSTSSASALPAAVIVSTAAAASEQYEGVLVKIENGTCTNSNLGAGEWEFDDGSAPVLIGERGFNSTPTLGTRYDVSGPLAYSNGSFKLEPRDGNDILWVGDDFAPVIQQTTTTNSTSVLVAFSEDLDQFTAEQSTNYTIAGLSVLNAEMSPGVLDQVELTVSTMLEGTHTLTVSDVEDLFGNGIVEVVDDFVYYGLPDGYYDSVEGLSGEPLRSALHQIIDAHTVQSYSYAWTAFWTTDDKPNGKVWDIYSDVPGGTPPYEYTFGVDQGGVGGVEGTGYSREHSWPRSWFGGDVSPMYSDLFALYPCDTHVNGSRGAFPYGEVASPEWISLNGSKRGNNSYPGYSGIVFEPIDAYKGDLARSYFYMSTRYFSEDASWPGSPMTEGASLLPWAVEMLLEWHAEDPVSEKELERNSTIYAMQNNRNPFIDRQEFATLVYAPATSVNELPRLTFKLHQNVPNPFNPATELSFELSEQARVNLIVYDAAGRLVKTLTHATHTPGRHYATWDGRDTRGRRSSSGVYFYRLTVGSATGTRKMILLR